MPNPYAKKVSADRLIEDHTKLVKKYAYFYAGRVQKAAEVEDLLQVGMIGLLRLPIIMCKKKVLTLRVMRDCA
jgi:DNA-directed RNA polymerase specialized sigma subunit